MTRPRARTVDGHEVPLASYTHSPRGPADRGGDGADAGRGGHPPARPSAEPVSERSAATRNRRESRRSRAGSWARRNRAGRAMVRDLTDLDIKVLMLDGEYMAER